MAQEVQIKKNVGDMVIDRINNLCEAGFNMPKDFNYVNAIKMTMLKLQDVKDKNGRSALEVCTPASIQTELFRMCCRGLNAALNQVYFIVRGDKLCIQDSYFGKILMVKRIFPDWYPVPVVIREGDVFEYGIDPTTGIKHIIKHEQKLENIDKDFVGGYIYLPNGELYIMTKKQILTAWSKSSSKEQSVHKSFDEKMVGKTLINSGCNIIINATPEYNFEIDGEDGNGELNAEHKLPEADKFEDFEEAEIVDEPKDEPKAVEQPVAQPQVDDDDF
jgi:recombination protein RecT